MSTQYNMVAVKAAEQAAGSAITNFLAQQSAATVVVAPAGAGKSEAVVKAVAAASRKGMRVAVATPTNEQAFGLVRRLAAAVNRQQVSFLNASQTWLPPEIAAIGNVQHVDPAQANGASVVVGTLSKLGDAFGRGNLHAFDALVIDEAFQADSSRYYSVGDLARSHLLVGDSGQLSPFSAIAEADRWRGLPEDPLQTAVGVLLRNHPTTPVFKVPISRRLDERAVPIARAFYPNLNFAAAVRAGVREVRLLPAVATNSGHRLLDHVLKTGLSQGWSHLELPNSPALIADPEIIGTIRDLALRLVQRGPEVRCEIVPAWKPLQAARIAVGVSHNDQKDLLRAELNAVGLGEVVVNTANKLQGLEYDIVIAWHPLTGLHEPDPFHLDPGRLSVLLTRHRHACIVIGRVGDSALLDGVPPSTPAHLGWDPDPVLDGWDIHREVFEALTPFRIVA